MSTNTVMNEWTRMYTHRFIASMQSIPNNVVGMAMKVWCVLSISPRRWRMEESLNVWSKVISEDEKTTRNFLNYLSDKVPEFSVVVKLVDNMPVYEVSSDWYEMIEHRGELGSKRSKAHRTSPLSDSREECFNKLITAYHPNRVKFQFVTAKRSFRRIMRDASRGVHIRAEKMKLEEKKVNEVLEYIDSLRNTKEWDEEGTFLLGFGNFLKQRPWETEPSAAINSKTRFSNNTKIERTELKDQVVSLANGND